jgi:hypothetical protein
VSPDRDEHEFRWLLHDFLVKASTMVEATEAAAFALDGHWETRPEERLRLLSHIRPDDSGPNLRAAAVQAFRQIVHAQLDAAPGHSGIRVGEVESGGAQYCLVVRLQDQVVTSAAAAFVCRCTDDADAARRLDKIGATLAAAGRRPPTP